MNNIITKFLLAGDKFMPEMHLRQPQFVYSACEPFTRHTENNKILAEEFHKPVIKKFNKTKVYSQYRDNIWGVDLADMLSLSKKK